MAESELSEHRSLMLQGELGIQQAEDIHRDLTDALRDTQWLEVDLSQARQVGLACLQMLCAAHHSARLRGKRMSIAPGASPEFHRAVERAGYTRQRGCGGPEDLGCFWNLENEQ